MIRFPLLISLCVIAAGAGAAQHAEFSVIRFDGIGPIRIGMNLSDVNKVLHTSYTKPTDRDEQACNYLEIPRQPGIGLMILDGRVARVDVDNASTHTAEGIHNGDSEAHALQVYGKRLEVEPHHYVESGHYLTLPSKDRKLGIVFETEDGKITRYYAGTSAAIAFVEGCS